MTVSTRFFVSKSDNEPKEGDRLGLSLFETSLNTQTISRKTKFYFVFCSPCTTFARKWE